MRWLTINEYKIVIFLQNLCGLRWDIKAERNEANLWSAAFRHGIGS